MIEARGVRIAWQELPSRIHAHVAAVLDGEVVHAVSQLGGFSPGSADRVVTASGRRAFVKAVSAAQNPRTPALHRREITVTAALPPQTPAPRLLGSFDDGDWVALILDDVDGVQPATPWQPDQVRAAVSAAADLAARLTPSPLPELGTVADSFADDFLGWERLRRHPEAIPDDWSREHVDLLTGLAAEGHAALGGNTLLHTDVRADNLLIRRDGSVVFVDWPWACTGPAWLDTLLLLINVALYGGHDVDALVLGSCPAVDGETVTAVLAGLAGFLTDAASRPPPPGLPTVRAFQAAQAACLREWVHSRVIAGPSRP